LENKNTKVLSTVGMVGAVLLLGFPIPAKALYVDPGTGSMILQVMAGGLLVLITTTKLYWKRLRSLFRKKDKA